MIYGIFIAVMLLSVAFWYGYQNGYETRKVEEENRARARAARLREFTAKGREENGEWYKVKERTNETTHV